MEKLWAGACLGTIVLGCALLSGCSVPFSTKSASVDYVEYQGSSFSILAPARWERVSDQLMEVVFLAPDDEGFQANLGVTIDGVQDDVTIEAVAEVAKASQMENYPEYSITREEMIEIGDLPALTREYEWRDTDYDLAITQRQVFIQSGNTMYSLTSTALTQNHGKYEPVFDEMIQSFWVD